MGLITHYVLFFIHPASRQVSIAGITPHPAEGWMKQIARNATMAGWGFLEGCRYLIHDRDTKYCAAFAAILRAAGVVPLPLSPRSPNLNAFAERFVLSVKSECLDKLILFGEASLRHVLEQFVEHYHSERNHQSKENRILFASRADHVGSRDGPIRSRQRLGGLLHFFYRSAA